LSNAHQRAGIRSGSISLIFVIARHCRQRAMVVVGEG
jgi:hypothetical protein